MGFKKSPNNSSFQEEFLTSEVDSLSEDHHLLPWGIRNPEKRHSGDREKGQVKLTDFVLQFFIEAKKDFDS